jgi:hypothetical protein
MKKNQKPNKLPLYAGLCLLLVAFTVKFMGMSDYCFWILLGVAITFKTFFIISVFKTKGFKPAMWLYFILTGVAVILISMLFKTIFPVPILHKILFYIAISLKITGLILMFYSKILSTDPKNSK